MDFFKIIRDLRDRVFVSSRCKFTSDYKKDIELINEIYVKYEKRILSEEPSRYLWRSVCQYRSQASIRTNLGGFIANFMALLCLPGFIGLVRPKLHGTTDRICTKYLKINYAMAYQIPPSIRNETLERVPGRRYLRLEDLIFVWSLFVKNRAWYPELCAKFLWWVSQVRPLMDTVKTEVLIQYCEYSAYSSLRKIYLNAHSIKLANVSHGEELISCRSAFSSFDQYFAWEIIPKRIHEAMFIEYDELYPFNPCSELPRAPGASRWRVVGILWPTSPDTDLAAFTAQVNNLCRDHMVIVRPHPNPAYDFLFETQKASLKAEISDSHVENIHAFVDRCDLLIGFQSAALLQAAFRGRDVVYLINQSLKAVQEYYDYYKCVPAIEMEELERTVRQGFGRGQACYQQ